MENALLITAKNYFDDKTPPRVLLDWFADRGCDEKEALFRTCQLIDYWICCEFEYAIYGMRDDLRISIDTIYQNSLELPTADPGYLGRSALIGDLFRSNPGLESRYEMHVRFTLSELRMFIYEKFDYGTDNVEKIAVDQFLNSVAEWLKPDYSLPFRDRKFEENWTEKKGNILYDRFNEIEEIHNNQ